MLRLWRPSEQTRQRLLADAQSAPLSVRADVAAFDLDKDDLSPPDDYAVGEWSALLGSGTETFDAACAALRRWDQFPAPLIRAEPTDTPIAIGETVSLAARVGPIHGTFACRITNTIDDQFEHLQRYGFVYTTIEGHVERGKELFLIEHDLSTDRVRYRIRAISRSAHPLGWLGLPFVRSVQRSFGPQSSAALQRAIDPESALQEVHSIQQRPLASLPWLGAILWALSLGLGDHSSRMHLCTFAALVLLPSARPLLPTGWFRSRAVSALWLLSAGGFAFFPGGELLWFLATVAAALRAIPSFLRRATAPEEWGATVGLLLLPVGSAWALLFRYGEWPGGFPAEVVELTALHFHYAGALFPLIFGHAVATWKPGGVRGGLTAYLIAVTGVALGISFSPTLEFLSAGLLIAIGGGLCAALFRTAVRATSRDGRRALLIAGSALALGLSLALGYSTLEWQGSQRGLEEYSGGGWLPWQRMVPLHGWTMALGFCAFSIYGLIVTRETTPRSDATE